MQVVHTHTHINDDGNKKRQIVFVFIIFHCNKVKAVKLIFFFCNYFFLKSVKS